MSEAPDYRAEYDARIAARVEPPLVLEHGEECWCHECAPLPPRIDPLQLASPAYRAERARMWAAAFKQPKDAIPDRIAGMERAWQLQRAGKAADAAAMADAAEVREVKRRGLGEYGRLRGKGRVRLRPRKLDAA